MTLVETLDAVAAELGRVLSPDELAVVGRLHDAGPDDVVARAVELLREPPDEVSDAELETTRYEGGRGNDVRKIR
ncbi:MAG: hypothetical protein ACRDH5_09430 [bacterium]